MNYYNPYFGGMTYTPALGAGTNVSSRGLLGSLFGGGKLSTFINGTQKTLNIINQAIPIVKQVSPVMKNAKTMFKVMNEFKRVDNISNNTNQTIKEAAVNNSNNNNMTSSSNVEDDMPNNNINNNPTFFL